jgi:hypothetical protein
MKECGIVFEVGTNSLLETARLCRQWLIIALFYGVAVAARLFSGEVSLFGDRLARRVCGCPPAGQDMHLGQTEGRLFLAGKFMKTRELVPRAKRPLRPEALRMVAKPDRDETATARL